MQSTLKAIFRGLALFLIVALLCVFALNATAKNAMPVKKVAAWNPSPRQIAAMGFNAYNKAYNKRGGDLSTAGMKQSAWHYADCKRADNNYRSAKKLPILMQGRIGQVRTSLEAFDGALNAMLELRAGGGTMYGVFAATATATGEDALGQIIAASAIKKRDAEARRHALADFAAAQRALSPSPGLQTPPLDAIGIIGAEQQKMYREAAETAAMQRAKLQSLAAQLPDAAARLLAARVANDAKHIFDTLSL